MRPFRTHLTRAAAVVAASATSLALVSAPAQAQAGDEGSSIDTSVSLLQTGANLQGGEGNLGNIAALLGSLSGIAEGDMNATQMVDAMSSFYQSGGMDYLAGIPGGLHDFVQTCMRAIAGQATIDDVFRQFNAIGAPSQRCNDESASGQGVGIYRRVELGRMGPLTFPLRYETVREPDSIRVFYEGRVIYQDMNVSTRGSRWVDVHVPPGLSTAVQVEVIPSDSRTTLWDFTVHCPR